MRTRALLVAAFALVAGLAVAPPPGDVIRVKGVAGDTVVQLTRTDGGGLVRADLMARLLGGALDSIAPGRWKLTLYGASLELVEGAPFAAYNGYALPLQQVTARIDGAPHVALQLFSEIIPRFGIGIMWDRTRAEVRLLQGIARRSVPTGPGDPAPGTVVATVATATTSPAPAAPSPSRTNGTPPTATRPNAGGGRPAAPRPPARDLPPATASRTPAPVPTGLSRRYTVVVDAGHGGRDPGMRGAVVDGRPLSEARVTLQVSRRLERLLAERGIAVVMTRTADTLIGLGDRGPIANRAKGDLFISVHVNSANPKWANPTAARGFETYFLSTARTEDEEHVAAMENDVVRFETDVAPPAGNDALSFIINDLARNEHLRESSEFAGYVQQRMAQYHPGPSRGVKQAGFKVLVTAYMPAVLVELGFGSNPQDARWMASEAGQEDAARAIADAALEYLQHYDRRTRASQR